MRRPLRHILVVVVVSLFCVAGVWQIHRLHERQAHNRRVRAGLAATPAQTTSEAYRRFVGRGTYDEKNQIVLRSRVLQDASGSDVLTPLVIRPDVAVLVDRGWVPLGSSIPSVRRAPVSIEGIVLPPEHKRVFSPDIPKTGHVGAVNYVNVARIARQLPYRLLPNYVLLRRQRPAYPTPHYQDAPELTDGPHRGYAVQWFLFALVSVVGYVAFLRRETATVAKS